MELELEPEVRAWLDGLSPGEFATVAFHLDRLATRGAQLRMPHSRAIGGSLFELRFDLHRQAHRITYFYAGSDRIVMLTVFKKQRQRERAELARARRALQAHGGTYDGPGR